MEDFISRWQTSIMIETKVKYPRNHYIQKNYPIRQPMNQKWGLFFVFFVLLIGIVGFITDYKTFIILAAILGFFSLIVGLFRPSIGLFGIGILCSIDAPMRVFLLTGVLRWNTFNYWLLFIILIYLPKLFNLKHPQIRVLQCFILLLGLGLIISPRFMEGVQHLLNIVIIFGLLIYFIRNRSNKQNWYWMSIITGSLTAIGSLLFFLQIADIPYINPNSWSYSPLTGILAINLGIPFSPQKKGSTLLLFFLAVFNFAFVFLSGSRGVLLVAAVCILLLIIQANSLNRRMSYVLILVLVIFTIFSQFTELQTNTLERLDRLVNPTYSWNQRTSGRSDIAMGGWYIFLEHPFGIGTGGFASAWADLGNLDGLLTIKSVGEEIQQHSAWMKILAENGFLGFILLFAFVISFAILGIRRKSRNLRIIGLLVSIVLSLTYMSTNFQGKGTWLLVAGAMVLLQEKEIQVPNIKYPNICE